jgi:hypothetical protein
MKHIAALALMAGFGTAGVYAQQRPVKMTYSGSMVATTIDFGPNTITDEEQLAGNGSLGQFTFRKLRTDETAPSSFGPCGAGSGPNIKVVAGGGVFRFQDGSLLAVKVTQGNLCVDLDHLVGHLTETYKILYGTGRFQGAAASCGAAEDCTLKLAGTLGAALFDASGNAKLLTNTGSFEGTISVRAIGGEQQNEGK